MKLIIDIPEEIYNNACATNNTWNMRMAGFVCSAIANGIPLDTHDEEIIATTVESIWGKPPYTDMLDKVRAEIAEYKDDKVIHAERNEMIDIVLEIIDKYTEVRE